MLARALRSGQQLFNFAPKVIIPEDPTCKPNFILKLMGFYNKDSVQPLQAKKLYNAAKEQVRRPRSAPARPHPFASFRSPLLRAEHASSFLRQCRYRKAISHRVSGAVLARLDDIRQAAQ